jgi:hypothetical protein
MGVEILIPVAFFAMIMAIVLVPSWFRTRERRDLQETVRHALDKGQELPAELVETIARSTRKPPATAHTDLRAGVIWLAIAAGIATLGWMGRDVGGEGPQMLLGLAAIPGFLGLAFVILSFFNKTRAD